MAKNPQLLNVFKFSFDNSVWNDAIFTETSDTDLENLLEFIAKKDLSLLTPEESYGVFLSAKREIYWKLAVSTAPLYGIEVDGTKVNKNQRFDHYFNLATQVDKEIVDYQNSGLASVINVGEVVLTSRHFDNRNYALTPTPIVSVKVDNVYDTKVEISWEVKRVTKFYNYIIYISNTKDIIDDYMYKGLEVPVQVKDHASLVTTILDIHQTKYRVEGLKPDTTYYLAVVCSNCNTVSGHSEIEFTTEVI